jgi:hypothetical protein
MKVDLVELLEYLGIDGTSGFWLILLGFIFWVLFSGDKVSEKIRMRVIKTFSAASSTIHIDQERLAERIGTDIDEILTHLQQETDANNAIVIRFRNGSYDSMGSSILKFFASNEKAKSGYLQIGEKIQNISRSLYGEFCDRLIRDHKVYVKDRQSVVNCPELMGVMALFNNPEKFYARSLVTSHDGQIVGFVCLVYSEQHRIAESKVDELLTEACARIVAKIEMGKLTINKKKKK